MSSTLPLQDRWTGPERSAVSGWAGAGACVQEGSQPRALGSYTALPSHDGLYARVAKRALPDTYELAEPVGRPQSYDLVAKFTLSMCAAHLQATLHRNKGCTWLF